MQDFCRKSPKPTQCEPEKIGKRKPPQCKPFQVCLPFGRSLKFDGACLTVEGTPTIEDGEYGVIVVENGCIVDARPNPVCEYTPPACTSAAAACSSTSSDITLQTGVCNLLSLDASGRLGAFLTVEAGDNISISGCGSSSSPLKITANVDVDTSVYIQTESSQQLTVSGSGTASDPYVIGLVEVIEAGTYGDFQVDEYGRVTKYTDPSTSSIVTVQGGNGIDVVTASGAAIITLAESGVETGDYQVGGYVFTLDLAGRVTEATRNITVTAGSYDMHDWLVTVNSYGSITGFTAYERPVTNHAVAHAVTLDVTTDVTGYLYVVWRGAMSVSASSATPYAYVDGSSYMTCTIEGEDTTTTVSNALGRLVSTSSSSTSTSYSLVEWRGRSVAQLPAGTYTVTVTATGTVSGTSVLEAFSVAS